MSDEDQRTVVACAPDADAYLLLTWDLETVHAWGTRQQLADAGVSEHVLDVAAAVGSARVATAQPGTYPWTVGDIQYGDYLVDRSCGVEFCNAAHNVEEGSGRDLSGFFVGMASFDWEEEDE